MKQAQLIALVFSFTLISCPWLPSLKQALRMAEESNFNSALSICDQHLLANPHNQAALRTRGSVRLIAGEYELAEHDLSHAIELNPKDHIALHNRGVVYHHLNKDNLSYYDLNTALELGHDNGAIRQYLAEICIRLKRFNEAIVHAQSGIESEPDMFIHYGNLGMALELSDRKEEALAAYDKAVQLDPDDSTVFVLRGLLLCKEGRRKEARSDFATARKMNAKWFFEKSCHCPDGAERD